jgi:hypothetical protein
VEKEPGMRNLFFLDDEEVMYLLSLTLHDENGQRPSDPGYAKNKALREVVQAKLLAVRPDLKAVLAGKMPYIEGMFT